jgi:hypothetical protein
MKAPNEVAPEGRVSRAGVLGTLALVLYLPACMSDCFLDRSGIVSDRFRYDCRAVIQSASGIRSEISTDNLMEFAGADAPIFAAPEDAVGQAVARDEWLRFLRRVLDERSGDETFRAVYGEGPWCVAGEPDVAATDVVVSWDEENVANESAEPLGTCVCGEECGNAEGVIPLLDVSPTPPGMPYLVEFGSVPVGTPSVREVTFTNSGEGRLCLNPPAIHGSSTHPDDFVLLPLTGCAIDPDGQLVLEGVEACRFRVTFTPSQAGMRSARIPGARGCGDFITLVGNGTAGQLSASPAPACFLPPSPPDLCREVPIRIDNMSSGTVSLLSTSITSSGAGDWQLARLVNSDGTTIDLAAGPYALGAGQFVNALVRACELATDESALRVMHNGTDYGTPGSPTGDVDAGSPLVVRLLPPGSGCTP